MKNYLRIITVFIFLGTSLQSFANTVTTVSWEMMEKLDYTTGKMSKPLQQVQKKMVSVSGFIVPLELDDYIDTVQEFLLVPNPLACIHIPPPPPNQMIYITMNKPIPLDIDFRGVTIKGVLDIITPKTADDFFGYSLAGISAKAANIEFEDPFIEYMESE